MTRIRILIGPLEFEAELADGPTAGRIAAALPIEAVAERWGEEVYFEIPVVGESEPGARREMAVGELGYWPPGRAFCIFFGPTPSTPQGSEVPTAYSAVNPIGRLVGDAAMLRRVRCGDKVVLERAGADPGRA